MSSSFASEAEAFAYPFISDAVFTHCSGFPALYSDSAESAIRIYPIDDELSAFLRSEYKGAQGQTSAQFRLYAQSSKDRKKWKTVITNCFNTGTEIEVDYFAYVDMQQPSHALKKMSIDEGLRANANVNAVSKRGSDTTECRKIVVFEISNAPEGTYKFAQLERDLKVVAFRQMKKGISVNHLLDVVALAGVSLKSQSECDLVQGFLDDKRLADFAPRIHSLHQQKKIVIVCHNSQPSNFTPKPVWVKFGGSTFEVEPAKNTVDSLKKAVKAERGIVQGLLPLLARNHAEEVLDDSAPLRANSKTEPYIIQRQEIWVKYGDAVFEVEPAKNTVDSLKKAVKAEMQLQQPAPTLVVKDHTGTVLEVDSLLECKKKDTAYVVE